VYEGEGILTDDVCARIAQEAGRGWAGVNEAVAASSSETASVLCSIRARKRRSLRERRLGLLALPPHLGLAQLTHDCGAKPAQLPLVDKVVPPP